MARSIGVRAYRNGSAPKLPEQTSRSQREIPRLSDLLLWKLPPHQPVHSATQEMHGLKRAIYVDLRNIPPSHGDANARLRFIQRPPRRFEPKPSIARDGAEPFRNVQSDTANGATQL